MHRLNWLNPLVNDYALYGWSIAVIAIALFQILRIEMA